MSSTVTVRDIDPADKAWLKREARQVGVSMEEFIRRLIRESVPRPSTAQRLPRRFRRYFGPEHGVELPEPKRYAYRKVEFAVRVRRERSCCLLIDANVISEMMRPHPEPRVAAFLDKIADQGIGLASITVWEILNGIGLLDAGRRLTPSPSGFRTCSTTSSRRGYSIDLRRRLEECARIMEAKRRRGEALEDHLPDAFLAATATRRSLTIVTRNTGEFRNTGVEVVTLGPMDDSRFPPAAALLGGQAERIFQTLSEKLVGREILQTASAESESSGNLQTVYGESNQFPRQAICQTRPRAKPGKVRSERDQQNNLGEENTMRGLFHRRSF